MTNTPIDPSLSYRLAMLDDPAMKDRVNAADALLDRLESARARFNIWSSANPNGTPSEIKLAEDELRAAKLELEEAQAAVRYARGDEIEGAHSDACGSANGKDESRSRQAVQEAQILRMLLALGYDPVALPKPLAGKPGTKAEVRGSIGAGGMWSGKTVFDKAWERLRKGGQIAEKS